MMMKGIIVCLSLLIVVSVHAGREEEYKKYIGETTFRLPFKTRISEPFQEGQTIHAVGTLSSEPHRVDFNFHKGADRNADIPLHLSIRFDEGIFSGKLVYNTFENGNWSDREQRISNPFRANQEFDLRVRILDNKFQVFANRVEVGTFEQRQSLAGIDHVSISGDLSHLRLFHYGGRNFTSPYAAQAQLIPGKRLDIAALPKGKRININLSRANRDIALQLSMRFSEGVCVRNAQREFIWGAEEREGEFTLNRNEIFDATIINEEFSFQIFFNTKRFCTFQHRGSPTDIATLEIDGDLEILTVTINTVNS